MDRQRIGQAVIPVCGHIVFFWELRMGVGSDGFLRRGACLGWGLGCALLLGLFAPGCNDPYSRNRIAMREDNIRRFEDGVGESEMNRARRRREAVETFNEWMASDKKIFERRISTIGDYIW